MVPNQLFSTYATAAIKVRHAAVLIIPFVYGTLELVARCAAFWMTLMGITLAAAAISMQLEAFQEMPLSW